MSSRAPYVISIRHATGGPLPEATRPLPGGTEVDKVLEFVTGQTMEMTGAGLVVLALPGEGHRQLTIRQPPTGASYRV